MRALLCCALAVAACAARPPAPTPLANHGVGSLLVLDWRAAEARHDDDHDPWLAITLAVGGRVVVRDVLCCTVVAAYQCAAHAAGPSEIWFTCADELTSWQAELVFGAVVITRVDIYLDSPQRERRTELARVATTATRLAVASRVSAPPRRS